MTVLTLTLLVSTWTAAKTQDFVLSGSKIRLDVPQEWQSRTDLLGLPLALISPVKPNQKRGVLSLAPGSQGDAKMRLGESFISSASKEYQENKSKWISSRKAGLIEFLPQTIENLGGKHKALVLGMVYEAHGKRNLEKSYYIECGERIYFAKLLVTSEQKDLLGLAQKSLESLECL